MPALDVLVMVARGGIEPPTLSTDSPFHGNVDEIFSTIALRDSHHYEVRLSDRTDNPRILELIREIDRPPAKAP